MTKQLLWLEAICRHVNTPLRYGFLATQRLAVQPFAKRKINRCSSRFI